MTLFAIFALYFIFQKLIVPGDSTVTVSNIMTNDMKFRFGICSYLVVIICDVLVAWALYAFLKPINKNLSLLAAWFRLVYATIFAVALVNYFDVLRLLSDSDYLAAFGVNQLHAKVMLSLSAFNDGWTIGLVFFGFHLMLLGYLVYISDYIPRVLGVLLIVAGASYLLDHLGKILFPEFDVATSMVAGWGELLFMFWLLFKGVNIE